MTLIERLIVLGVLGGGIYMAFEFDVVNWDEFDVVNWGDDELTVYPIRCLNSWGEFRGMPKCETEEIYTYVLDAGAGEVHIKTDETGDFIVRQNCQIESEDNWICPPQMLEIMPGRPTVMGPVLCTREELRAGKCDIEKNTVQDFGRVDVMIPRLVVVDGLPLRDGDACIMSRHYTNAAQWLAIKGAEFIGRISMWPAEPEEC